MSKISEAKKDQLRICVKMSFRCTVCTTSHSLLAPQWITPAYTCVHTVLTHTATRPHRETYFGTIIKEKDLSLGYEKEHINISRRKRVGVGREERKIGISAITLRAEKKNGVWEEKNNSERNEFYRIINNTARTLPNELILKQAGTSHYLR